MRPPPPSSPVAPRRGSAGRSAGPLANRHEAVACAPCLDARRACRAYSRRQRRAGEQLRATDRRRVEDLETARSRRSARRSVRTGEDYFHFLDTELLRGPGARPWAVPVRSMGRRRVRRCAPARRRGPSPGMSRWDWVRKESGSPFSFFWW